MAQYCPALHASESRLFTRWALYIIPSRCRSMTISGFLPLRFLSPAALLALLPPRVQSWAHFLLFHGEFVGPNKQQGIFLPLYYIYNNLFLPQPDLLHENDCISIHTRTVRPQQFRVEPYAVCGNTIVLRNSVSLWLCVGGGCWLLHLKFTLCFQDAE